MNPLFDLMPWYTPERERDQRYWTRKRMLDHRRRQRRYLAIQQRVVKECFAVIAERSPFFGLVSRVHPSIFGFRIDE